MITLYSGSQRFYVTNQLRNSLKLCTDTVSIKTFGSSSESTQVCDVVELKIGTKQGEPVVITVLLVPNPFVNSQFNMHKELLDTCQSWNWQTQQRTWDLQWLICENFSTIIGGLSQEEYIVEQIA
uniref:Uncharacterized protein n=1 Tax=Amphimedon queenslandica TaxID=400682 RepID=A0A1X7TNA7_AMPQE